MNYKSGLRILILPPEVPFFWSQRWALLAKATVFYFGHFSLVKSAKNKIAFFAAEGVLKSKN